MERNPMLAPLAMRSSIKNNSPKKIRVIQALSLSPINKTTTLLPHPITSTQTLHSPPQRPRA